jgi:hypothetical protein
MEHLKGASIGQAKAHLIFLLSRMFCDKVSNMIPVLIKYHVLGSGTGTVVKHLTHNPMLQGSNPTVGVKIDRWI